MALGLAVAAALLIAWPIFQVVTLIRALPWGGERELAPIVLTACVFFLFAVVAPGVFTAIDRTSVEALVQLLDIRNAANHWDLGGVFRPFDGLRAAPFLFGAKDLSSQIWIADLLLVLITLSVFAGGARIGGIFGGAAAMLFLPIDASMLRELRSFEIGPALLAGIATAFVTITAGRKGVLPRFSIVVALGLLFLAIFSAVFSGAATGTVSLLHGKASIFPCATIAIAGGSTLRWWSKGLRTQPIDWKSFNTGMMALALSVFAGLTSAIFHPPSSLPYLTLHLVAAIVGGGVIGGLLRMLRWHALAAPAIVIAISIFRIGVMPFDAKRIGGFASTVDDLKAVVPAQVQLGSSINPTLAVEFLGRSVQPLRLILNQKKAASDAPIIIETRFASELELREIEQQFRLVPILPGISWAYNLREAQPVPDASQQ